MNAKNKERAPIPFARVILRMIGLAWQSAPGIFMLYLVSIIAFTALYLAGVIFIRVLVDRLPLFVQGALSYQGILTIVLLYGGVGLLCGISNSITNLTFEYGLKLTSGRMARHMHEKAHRIDLIHFESAGLFNDIDNAVNGRDRGFEVMEKVVCSILFHGGYFLLFSLYLATFKWQLIPAIAASFIPVAVSRYIRASAWYEAVSRTSPLRRELKHYEECLTDRRYFKETRTLGAGGFLRGLYDKTLAAYNREMWTTEARTGLVDLGLKLFTLTGYFGVLALLVFYLLKGEISAGVFGAVYFSMNTIFKQFDEIFDRLGSALQDSAITGLYFKFMDLPERTGRVATVSHDRGVALSDVTFRYPGESGNAVESVSLDIRPGEMLAIVGENGAGKSTLVKLICGMLLPGEGSVRIGGTDTRDAEPRALYDGISAVFQGYQRYRLTLRENVVISDAGNPPDDARIRDALDRTGVPVESLPGGLDAVLSPEFDGIDLSGGQWQRVAIARGLYRAHDLIVLDEPTSTIDPLEETQVYRLFAEAARGKTGVLVTHRLGSARIADRIIVMDGGRIVEEGSHQALVDAGGKYARLWQAQARWYERE
jgi:ATP-binding cassette subfamily B protein